MASNTNKNVCSLSLDLDNKWSYLKTRGDERWEALPTYLDLVVPRILELHKKYGFRITVFIVGLDADQEVNAEALRSIADAGHEIGNHSYKHEPWLHLYSREEVEAEFEKTESALQRVTGKTPVGFRGPGFSFSDDVLSVMSERGYQYDCSTFPTFLGPMARAYYFFKTRLSGEDRKQRKALFGSFWDGFQRLKPFRWNTRPTELLEIPVTTIPIIRAPLHLSYVMFLARWSEWLAINYFQFSLLMCRIRGIEPSILLHPLDFMGCDDDRDLEFFPAMDIPSGKKLRIMDRVFSILSKSYSVVTMQEHAAKHAANDKLPIKAVPVRG
ncbi:MAG: polysaccharide deacetylase family protein [Pirellulaceae bacterium]